MCSWTWCLPCGGCSWDGPGDAPEEGRQEQLGRRLATGLIQCFWRILPGPASKQESQSQGHTIRNNLEPPTVSVRQLSASRPHTPGLAQPHKHRHRVQPAAAPAAAHGHTITAEHESQSRQDTGLGHSRSERQSLPGADSLSAPSRVTCLTHCLTFQLPDCVFLCFIHLSLWVSLGVTISGGSLTLGDSPCVSVPGSLSLHPCWSQHNFTSVPPCL